MMDGVGDLNTDRETHVEPPGGPHDDTAPPERHRCQEILLKEDKVDLKIKAIPKEHQVAAGGDRSILEVAEGPQVQTGSRIQQFGRWLIEIASRHEGASSK